MQVILHVAALEFSENILCMLILLVRDMHVAQVAVEYLLGRNLCCFLKSLETPQSAIWEYALFRDKFQLFGSLRNSTLANDGKIMLAQNQVVY